jgi:hypothetical protein
LNKRGVVDENTFVVTPLKNKPNKNAIVESFLWAYYRHHDIVLSPDDMWFLEYM